MIGRPHTFVPYRRFIYKRVCTFFRKLQSWICSAWTWKPGPGLNCKTISLTQWLFGSFLFVCHSNHFLFTSDISLSSAPLGRSMFTMTPVWDHTLLVYGGVSTDGDTLSKSLRVRISQSPPDAASLLLHSGSVSSPSGFFVSLCSHFIFQQEILSYFNRVLGLLPVLGWDFSGPSCLCCNIDIL